MNVISRKLEEMIDFAKTKKQYIFKSFWISVGNMLKVMSGIVLIPIISRYLLPETLGKFDFMFSLTPILGQIISMGLTNSISMFYMKDKNPAYLSYIQKKIVERTVLVVILIGFGLIVCYPIWLHQYAPAYVFLLFLFSTLMENISFVPNLYYALNKEFIKRTIVNVIVTVSRYLITIVLVITLPDKLLALFLGILISNIILMSKTFGDNHSQVMNKQSLTSIQVKELQAYSRPLFILGIFGFVYLSADRLLLGILLKAHAMEQIGYYGLGARIVTLISLGLSGIFEMWGVVSFEGSDKEKLLQYKNILILLLGSVLILVPSLMMLMRPWVIKYVFTPTFQASFSISIWLVVIFCWNKMREILEISFLKDGRSSMVTKVFVVATLLNLTFQILLIPKYGMVGSLFSTLVATMFHTGIWLYYSHQKKFYVNLLPFIICCVFTVAILGVA